MTHARDAARLSRTGVPVVNTAQELRDLPWFSANPPEAIQTLGAVTAGDGGGGLFRWDLTSVADDNLGTVLLPTGSLVAGRWKREYSGAANVRWFGAVGDGVADDTTRIQATIDTCSSVSLDSGNYGVTQSLVLNTGTILRGPGTIRRINPASDAAYSVITADNISSFEIKNLTIHACAIDAADAAGQSAAAEFGKFNTCIDVRQCSDWSVRSCVLREFKSGILFSNASKDFIIDGNSLHADNAATIASILDGTYNAVVTWPTNGSYGIAHVWYNNAAETSCYNWVISNNTINCAGLDIGICGLNQIWAENPGIIQGNVIRGGNCGIQIYRGSYPYPDTEQTWTSQIITDSNHISATWVQGIYVRAVQGTIVSNNQLVNTAQEGTDGNDSAGAIVLRVPVGATWPASTTTLEPGNVVTGNSVINPGRNNVALDAAVHIKTLNTVFTGNSITREANHFPVSLGEAVRVDGDPSCTISNNNIDNFMDGIHLIESANVNSSSYASWRIEGNTIKNITNISVYVSQNKIGGSVYNNTCYNGGTGIKVRSQFGVEICENNISDQTTGIETASGTDAGNYAFLSSRGVIAAGPRRGGSLIIRGNVFSRVNTPYLASETANGDFQFIGRTAVWEGDVIDGVPLVGAGTNRSSTSGAPNTGYSARNWNQGDFQYANNMSAYVGYGQICTLPGTYGQAGTTTADATAGSPVLTNVASLSGWGPGMYITVSGATGTYRIIDIDTTASTITLAQDASATSAGATLDLAAPTFVKWSF